MRTVFKIKGMSCAAFQATIENGIINLKVNDEIVVENRNGEEWIYLYSFYNAENQIARNI